MKRKYFLAILPFLCIASTTFAQVIDDSIDKELNKNPSEKQELKVEDFKMEIVANFFSTLPLLINI